MAEFQDDFIQLAADDTAIIAQDAGKTELRLSTDGTIRTRGDDTELTMATVAALVDYYLKNEALTLARSDGTAKITVTETGAGTAKVLLDLVNNGPSQMRLENTDEGSAWVIGWDTAEAGKLAFELDGSLKCQIDSSGNFVTSGFVYGASLTAGNGATGTFTSVTVVDGIVTSGT